MLLCQVMPFVVPFRLYSSLHVSSLTQHIFILWSGCWLTQGKIKCAQKRLCPSYLSWHIFESYTTMHNRKDFCSCLEAEFQGSGQRTLKILGQAQCFLLDVALREILMSFSSEPAVRGNYLVVQLWKSCAETIVFNALKTYFLPVSIKLNNYIFSSPHPECNL